MLSFMAMERKPGVLSQLGALVEAREVKIVFAALVVISVLPFPVLEKKLAPLFLAAFGAELLIRLVLLIQHRKEHRPLERTFVFIDLLAFLSFLPIDKMLDERGMLVLTMLRLTRLLVLVRFAREIAADVYSIMTRREQLQQFGLVTAGVFTLSFASAVLLQHLNIGHQYDPNAPDMNGSFLDRLWWSFRQLESADNLVESLRVSPVVAMLSLTLTIIGVFIVSFIIGIGANIVDQVVRAGRRRPVGHSGHSLVIGPVHNTEVLVREFVKLYERNRPLRHITLRDIWQWLFRGGPRPRRHALPKLSLLGAEEDPPVYLYEPMMRWVMYRKGEGSDPEALERVSAKGARRAILLSKASAGPDADAMTLTALSAFRGLNAGAQVFVEMADSQNRPLMQAVGGPHTFVLDKPHFLGLFLGQHLLVPGIEKLYTDLMNIEGSELYTHIFVEPEELTALPKLSKEGELSFTGMMRAAYRKHGVILVGAFLGEPNPKTESGFVPVETYARWLNPKDPHIKDERVKTLGGKIGMIPTKTLTGLIGICATYAPIHRYSLDLIMGKGFWPVLKRKTELGEGIVERLKGAVRVHHQHRRVLIVGFSEALPTLLKEIARSMPGVKIVLVLGERGDERKSLDQRLSILGLSADRFAMAKEGMKTVLEGGAVLLTFIQKGQNLSAFAAECVAEIGAVDAAVFVSEPEAADRDARTTMRVLRFVQALERNEVPKGERLQLLAEFVSEAKGEQVRRFVDAKKCGFAGADRLRLTIVCTERIKNYFMVHSAFVPGVTALYGELLGEGGQSIERLEVPSLEEVPGGSFGFLDLIEIFGERGQIPVALEMKDGSLNLNPAPQARFRLNEISAIFALVNWG